MNPLEYLRILRRRWPIIAAVVAAALSAAWFTTAVVPIGPPIRYYEATTVILNTGTLNVPGISNLNTVAALTTVGEVPIRVAEKLNYQGDPVTLAGGIEAFADNETGILRIIARKNRAEEARQLSDTFANELLGFLSDRKTDAIAGQAEFLNKRLETLQQEIAELDGQIAEAPEPQQRILTPRRDAKIRIYGVLYEQYQGLISQTADPTTLQIVQKASPQAIVQEGFQPPRSRTGRMFFAGVLGLLVGVGLVLLLERIDTKIRNRRVAEQHFSLPVLGEIPRLSWRESRRASIAAVEEPGSPWADAFRLLEAGLSRVTVPNGGGDHGVGETDEPGARRQGSRLADGREPSRTILVTSAGPGEGKTMVVANLAATYAELGKRVLVLSCDFRRPTIHRLFGIPNDQGLTDALQTSNGQPLLRGHVRPTSLANVRVVPSGASPEKAGELLSSPNMRDALAEARNEADVVLLDTPPILATSDASYLFAEVDAVLMVARAGKTTSEVAERSTDLLRRLGAPVVGIALNGSTEDVVPRGYYYRSDRPSGNGMGVFPN